MIDNGTDDWQYHWWFMKVDEPLPTRMLDRQTLPSTVSPISAPPESDCSFSSLSIFKCQLWRWNSDGLCHALEYSNSMNLTSWNLYHLINQAEIRWIPLVLVLTTLRQQSWVMSDLYLPSLQNTQIFSLRNLRNVKEEMFQTCCGIHNCLRTCLNNQWWPQSNRQVNTTLTAPIICSSF